VFVKSRESFEKFAPKLLKGNNIVAIEFKFYLIWICKYLVVSKGVVISNNYLSLTMLFFKHDELLALDPMFLGFVYNSLYCAIGKNLILNNETKKYIYIIF
jgi:hypothetical protein